MNWFKKLFKTSEEIDIHTVDTDDTEIDIKEETKQDLVDLFCDGVYKFSIDKNEESYNEWSNRVGKLRINYNNNYGMINNLLYHYYHYHLAISYEVDVTYNNITYNLSNKFKYKGYYKEDSAYESLFKILKDDDELRDVGNALERDIIDQLEEHLKNNNIKEIKKIINDNNSFNFSLTIKTEKTKNM